MPTTLGLALPNCGFGRGDRPAPEHRDLLFALTDTAEETGLDAVWVGDHLAFPLAPSAPYPYDARPLLPAASAPLDPIATLCVLAGRTERIRLGFGVLVLPYRHPLVVAKLVTSLDVFAGAGRTVLGVGAGWMPEEHAACGVRFDARDDVCDEAVQYLRACWTGEPVFHGRHFSVDGMTVLPRPVSGDGTGVPIWTGGNGRRAMARAARWGDGWNGLYAPPADFARLLDRLHGVCEDVGRDASDLAVSVHGLMLPDPGDRPAWDAVERDLRGYAALGVHHVALGLAAGQPDGGRRALRHLVDRVGRAVAA